MDMDFEESFKDFLLQCTAENVVERINRRYPGVDIVLGEGPDLPELVKHEVWCCECGCGEITPVKTVMYSMYAIDRDENLQEVILETHWTSPHTRNGGHEGLFVWNNQTDVEVCGKYMPGTC